MKNSIKRQLKTGKTSIGAWVSIGHPDVAEILAGVGFDWLLFDMEHAPLTIESLHPMVQAMNGSKTAPLVRVASKDLMPDDPINEQEEMPSQAFRWKMIEEMATVRSELKRIASHLESEVGTFDRHVGRLEQSINQAILEMKSLNTSIFIGNG